MTTIQPTVDVDLFKTAVTGVIDIIKNVLFQDSNPSDGVDKTVLQSTVLEPIFNTTFEAIINQNKIFTDTLINKINDVNDTTFNDIKTNITNIVQGTSLFATDSIKYFINNEINKQKDAIVAWASTWQAQQALYSFGLNSFSTLFNAIVSGGIGPGSNI